MRMKWGDFSIGIEFTCGGKRWRCTDVGSRVIVAICLEPVEKCTLIVDLESSHNMQSEITLAVDTSWSNGPPYAVCETVFDEYDIEGCELAE